MPRPRKPARNADSDPDIDDDADDDTDVDTDVDTDEDVDDGIDESVPISPKQPPTRAAAGSGFRTPGFGRTRTAAGSGIRASDGPGLQTPDSWSLESEARSSEVDERSEIIDTSTWLTTGESAALVKRSASTIKAWHKRGKIRGTLGPDACWRFNPDDLAEMMDKDGDDDSPSKMLAVGMTTIVQHGDKAGERLLAMTAVTTDGLERTCAILQENLEKAYARITELEKKLSDAIDRGMANLEASYKHERIMKKREHEHELALAEKSESGTKLVGLLQMLGPIAASIVARMKGDEERAQRIEGRAVGLAGSGLQTPDPQAASRKPQAPVAFEARIVDALARLETEICALDDSTASGFALMLPGPVKDAVLAIRNQSLSEDVRGRALGTAAQAAAMLPAEAFEGLRAVAPAGVVAVLLEIRKLNEEKA